MRKTLLLALTAALVLASATQASAALRILKISYKSPRPAGEYVLIKNKGTKAVAMKGWTYGTATTTCTGSRPSACHPAKR